MDVGDMAVVVNDLVDAVLAKSAHSAIGARGPTVRA